MSLQTTLAADDVRAARVRRGDLDDEPSHLDRGIAWLREHGAGYGGSIALHALAVTLATFSMWATQPPGNGAGGTTPGFAASPQPKIRVAPRGSPTCQVRTPSQMGGHTAAIAAPVPQAPSRRAPTVGNPVPDVATNGQVSLDTVGVGGGGGRLGGWEGLGNGGGRGGFFGTGGDAEADTAHKIVYVIDQSGSMTDSIEYVMPRRLSHNLSMMRAVKRMFISSFPI